MKVYNFSYDFSLGLSHATNSHKPSTSGNEKVPKDRDRKGLKGISSLGKKMVRSGAAYLEIRHGKRNLTFGTLTLPPLNEEDFLKCCQNWHDLKRKFSQELSRILERRGLDPSWVDVTEVQQSRFLKTGEVGLHLHYLHQGKMPGKHWAIGCEEIKNLWARLLQNLLGHDVDCSAATRIESVRKSAKGYLGKYMSKGGEIIELVKAAGKSDYLPHAWWGISHGLRKIVKDNIVILNEKTQNLIVDNIQALKDSGYIAWYYPIYTTIWFENESEEILIGYVGGFSNFESFDYFKNLQLIS